VERFEVTVTCVIRARIQEEKHILSKLFPSEKAADAAQVEFTGGTHS